MHLPSSILLALEPPTHLPSSIIYTVTKTGSVCMYVFLSVIYAFRHACTCSGLTLHRGLALWSAGTKTKCPGDIDPVAPC